VIGDVGSITVWVSLLGRHQGKLRVALVAWRMAELVRLRQQPEKSNRDCTCRSKSDHTSVDMHKYFLCPSSKLMNQPRWLLGVKEMSASQMM
jgi:hypothetical protein